MNKTKLRTPRHVRRRVHISLTPGRRVRSLALHSLEHHDNKNTISTSTRCILLSSCDRSHLRKQTNPRDQHEKLERVLEDRVFLSVQWQVRLRLLGGGVSLCHSSIRSAQGFWRFECCRGSREPTAARCCVSGKHERQEKKERWSHCCVPVECILDLC